MSQSTCCLGIDLGTSNSALAIADSLGPESGGSAEIVPQIFEVPQTSPTTLVAQNTLPSVLYVLAEGETAAPLPWETSGALAGATVAGVWARERGAQVPDRVISSAKSWLCNPRVDRRGEILPWGSEIVDKKRSPVESSRLLLEHLKAAFEHGRRSGEDHSSAADCRVVITVPASFDEVARGLTHEAAERAGWGRVTLLEEPQAAFYAWISQSKGEWRRQVQPGEIILVVDVGGGTADFSLIAISSREGDLHLERVSVGEHLLLGGDNMDLAMAHLLKAKLEGEGHTLDAWQFGALVHGARQGKERLLSGEGDAPDEFPISVPSRGAKLFAKTISTKLLRAEVEATVLGGFFPRVASDAMPAARRSIGLQEYGLPFVSDPAVSRHLARFLRRSLANVRSDAGLSATVPNSPADSFLRPTAVLFNGGVFKSPALRRRTVELLDSWSPDQPVRELAGADYELGVAKGAAFYARLAELGDGIRIKAGTARSYYLGLEASQPAVPGYEPPIRGLCVVPQGVEEGSELESVGREFGLVTGEPVEFRFFSSAVRAGDSVGALVDDAPKELEESAPLRVTLPSMENGGDGEIVPVRLQSNVTEVGTLELWMKHTQSDRKWNLEFNVRPDR